MPIRWLAAAGMLTSALILSPLPSDAASSPDEPVTITLTLPRSVIQTLQDNNSGSTPTISIKIAEDALTGAAMKPVEASKAPETVVEKKPESTPTVVTPPPVIKVEAPKPPSDNAIVTEKKASDVSVVKSEAPKPVDGASENKVDSAPPAAVKTDAAPKTIQSDSSLPKVEPVKESAEKKPEASAAVVTEQKKPEAPPVVVTEQKKPESPPVVAEKKPETPAIVEKKPDTPAPQVVEKKPEPPKAMEQPTSEQPKTTASDVPKQEVKKDEAPKPPPAPAATPPAPVVKTDSVDTKTTPSTPLPKPAVSSTGTEVSKPKLEQQAITKPKPTTADSPLLDRRIDIPIKKRMDGTTNINLFSSVGEFAGIAAVGIGLLIALVGALNKSPGDNNQTTMNSSGRTGSRGSFANTNRVSGSNANGINVGGFSENPPDNFFSGTRVNGSSNRKQPPPVVDSFIRPPMDNYVPPVSNEYIPPEARAGRPARRVTNDARTRNDSYNRGWPSETDRTDSYVPPVSNGYIPPEARGRPQRINESRTTRNRPSRPYDDAYGSSGYNTREPPRGFVQPDTKEPKERPGTQNNRRNRNRPDEGRLRRTDGSYLDDMSEGGYNTREPW